MRKCIRNMNGGEGTWWYSDPLPYIAPKDLRRLKQNMIDYLKRECPQIYGDLKDEPIIDSTID